MGFITNSGLTRLYLGPEYFGPELRGSVGNELVGLSLCEVFVSKMLDSVIAGAGIRVLEFVLAEIFGGWNHFRDYHCGSDGG